MTAADAAALVEIKRLEQLGAIRFDWEHALPRMRERGASRADVRHAIASTIECALQENGRYLLTGGVDLDDDELKVVVEIIKGYGAEYDYVITVF